MFAVARRGFAGRSRKRPSRRSREAVGNFAFRAGSTLLAENRDGVRRARSYRPDLRPLRRRGRARRRFSRRPRAFDWRLRVERRRNGRGGRHRSDHATVAGGAGKRSVGAAGIVYGTSRGEESGGRGFHVRLGRVARLPALHAARGVWWDERARSFAIRQSRRNSPLAASAGAGKNFVQPSRLARGCAIERRRQQADRGDSKTVGGAIRISGLIYAR